MRTSLSFTLFIDKKNAPSLSKEHIIMILNSEFDFEWYLLGIRVYADRNKIMIYDVNKREKYPWWSKQVKKELEKFFRLNKKQWGLLRVKEN